MSRRDVVVTVSRALAVLLSVWALAELANLPAAVYSFMHYADQGISTSTAAQYWRQHYFMVLGFLVVKIIGFSLMSRWLFRCGPDIDKLLLPEYLRENPES